MDQVDGVSCSVQRVNSEIDGLAIVLCKCHRYDNGFCFAHCRDRTVSYDLSRLGLSSSNSSLNLANQTIWSMVYAILDNLLRVVSDAHPIEIQPERCSVQLALNAWHRSHRGVGASVEDLQRPLRCSTQR